MADPFPGGTPPQGAPAAPATPAVVETPAPVEYPSERVVVTDDSALPGEPGSPEATPAGTLPPDVHPAVTAERQRAQRYRGIASQVYEFNEQGAVIGYNPAFLEKIAGAGVAARPGTAEITPEAAYQASVQKWAENLGFAPEQVDGIIRLAEAIADQRVNEATGGLYESSNESLKAQLISSGDVPPQAAPFVAKWMDQAFKVNPRAAMSREGRETVLRQALGEYALRSIRARRSGTRSPAPAPSMLRPAPGPGGQATPSADEQLVRRKLGLAPGFTASTPVGEELIR